MKNALILLALTCWLPSAYCQVSDKGKPDSATQSQSNNKALSAATNHPIPCPEECKQAENDDANLKIQRKGLKVSVDAFNTANEAAYFAYETWLSTEKAAQAAVYAASFAFVMMLIAGIQVWMFKRQLNTMDAAEIKRAEDTRDILNNAERNLIAANRPWVKVAITLAGDWQRKSNGDFGISIQFVLTNVGNSPARAVYPTADFYPILDDWDIGKKQAEVMTKHNQTMVSGFIGVSLFPNEPFEIPMGITLSKADIDKSNAQLAEKGVKENPPLPSLKLIGTVHYKTTLSDKTHNTGFIRDFGMSMGVDKSLRQLPDWDVIPKAQLALRHVPYGDGEIN